MKKLIKNYLAKLQENDKKGFSLVELIIVMAIMAILVGVVASQVLPYMEKSRQSKDQQQLSGLCTDIVSAISQSQGAVSSFSATSLSNCANQTGETWVDELGMLRSKDGENPQALASIQNDLAGKFTSKMATKDSGDDTVVVEYDASGIVHVWVTGAGADTASAAKTKLYVKSE